MARVKVCPSCGAENSPQEFFCVAQCHGGSCGTSLDNVGLAEAGGGRGGTPRASNDDHPGTPSMHAVPATSIARTTREPVYAEARLNFPWGDEPVGAVLLIGRDEDLPLSGRLEAFDTVSGRHAEISVHPSGVMVTHIGKNNPTYVNGRALQLGESAVAEFGARISFSRAVSAIVTKAP